MSVESNISENEEVTVPKQRESDATYGEDGPVTKRPERNRPETIREVCPGADIRKTDDTDDSDNELRKENRKRTYAVPKPRQPSAEVQNSNLTSVEYLPPEKNADSSSSLKTPVKSESVTPRNRSDIPVMKVRQPSAEKQEKIPPQPEKAESSGSVRTSVPSAPITPRSEEHVPAKRKRTPRTISSQKTPSPKKKEEPMSCHSRTHLRLDPDWVSPRMEKQQLELQQQRGGRSKDNEKKKRKKKKGSHSRKRKEERRKRRAKTASDIIKLKVNGNRVTPLTKSPTSTSQTSGKISKSSEQVLTRRHRASSTSRSTLKSKSTDVQQTIMLDSATQTSLIRLSVPQSTTTEEVRREEETPKKKKGWFARCCGRK